jgi:subtilisin family serine protease
MSKKPEFTFGGQPMSLTKSTTEAAIRVSKGAAMPPGTSRNSRSVDDFTLIKTSRAMDAKLDALRKRPEVQNGTHVYYVNGETDIPYIPTGKMYVEFLSDSNIVEHYDLFEKYHLTVLEVVFPGAYRLQVTPESPNPIKCIIALQKHKKVLVAEPDLATVPISYEFDVPRGSFSLTQWHHENLGAAIPIIDIPNAVFGSSHFKRGADSRVKDAWKAMGSLGSKNIKIAVIDTGFYTEHPMLWGDGTKIRAPYNAVTNTSDAGPFYTTVHGDTDVFEHGTSCAAVAAGTLQNGVIGVAPNSRIIPIRLDMLTNETIINAFKHAMLNGADVISCSLGYPKPHLLPTDVANFIRQVARTGRGGKGIPIFIAAGNANPASNGVPREVSDFAAHPDVCCITASNSLDESSSYSFFGSNALITAPTNGNDGVGITTASVQMSGGGADATYVSGFGGTSSAAPLAAGVAALMLSVNPNLTALQIKQLMAKHAEKIPARYDANGHSTHVGYGRINALKLVQAAAGGGTAATPTPVPTPTPAPRPVPSPGPVGPPPPASVTSRKGVVTSKFLNVRDNPSLTANKVARLNEGDRIEVLEFVGEWYKIGIGKYVNRDFVRLTTAEVVASGKVVSKFLNVRSGPSTSHAKVRQIFLGEKVNVHETTADGWYRINKGEWVLGMHIRLD